MNYYLIWHINLFKYMSKLRSVIITRVFWIDNVKVNILMNKSSLYRGFQLLKTKKCAFIITDLRDYRMLEEMTFCPISSVFVLGDQECCWCWLCLYLCWRTLGRLSEVSWLQFDCMLKDTVTHMLCQPASINKACLCPRDISLCSLLLFQVPATWQSRRCLLLIFLGGGVRCPLKCSF